MAAHNQHPPVVIAEKNSGSCFFQIGQPADIYPDDDNDSDFVLAFSLWTRFVSAWDAPPNSTSAGGHSVWKSGHTPRITWRHLSNVACQEEVASWNVYFAGDGKHAPTVGMYEKGKGMCTADV